MNAFLTLVERIAAGPIPEALDRPILDFGNGKKFTEKDLMSGTLVLGSVGLGKSTLAKTYLHAMLSHGFGGLVLAVKPSQIDEVREACRRAERAEDCIVFGPDEGHVFNPFEFLDNPSEATDLLVELSEILKSSRSQTEEDEGYWKKQVVIVLTNLFVLCHAIHGRLDLEIVAKLFAGRASTESQVSDPTWLQSSNLAKALRSLQPRSKESEIELAFQFFTKDYPLLGDRTQGSLSSCVAGVFDRLRRPPLVQMFSGRSTFSMDAALNGGKIIVVGLPALQSQAGRFANAIMQFIFCRQATQSKRVNNAFLLSDECQETVSPELTGKAALIRESRVAMVLLTQSLSVLEARLGEVETKALCGILRTQVFFGQSDAKTREWAAEQCGKEKKVVETTNRGESSGKHGTGRSSGVSTHESMELRVQPTRFAELEVGETICVKGGKPWRADWPELSRGKKGTVRVL